ncbi:hypothetical protein WR25_14320 [Diploscapter pachys]|uniref:S1 motif domain-containing protein n=1 Tax=Diploscapter pachys TaxID=2018661 RepID=A0A2A2KH05_9BILA|nr:hypothetical protein WR25_14320 [Diploscapter pachys]
MDEVQEMEVKVVSGPPAVAPDRLLAEIERDGVKGDKIVVPGNVVIENTEFMRGHGTYIHAGKLCASLTGTVQQVNRLVSVKPVKSRYGGEVGDVVIGRVTDVQQKRWKLDVNGRLDANLPLSSVNLPGGELRKKSLEDELMMREYLREGDLLSAEIHEIRNDGTVNLHTRSLKYGKLAQGILVVVPPHTVKRRKMHFHSLPCGCAVIIGCNGYVWVTDMLKNDNDGGYHQDLSQLIPLETRKTMCRVAAVIELLAAHSISIFDSTITLAHDLSMVVEVKELKIPAIAAEIALAVVEKLQHERLAKSISEGRAATPPRSMATLPKQPVISPAMQPLHHPIGRDRSGSGAEGPHPTGAASHARRPTSIITKDPADLRFQVKMYLTELLEQLFRANGLISIGVSGGSMPHILCDVFKTMENVKWKRVKIFMVDERYVESSDPQSNYGQYLALLPPPIQESLVHVPILETVQKSAQQYELVLKQTCQPECIGNKMPRFDIVFLGVGPDGHTASIFPGDKLTKYDPQIVGHLGSSWVYPVLDSPKLPPKRITLGLNALRVAKNTAFIITGEEKANVVKGILSGDTQYPAAQVRPMNHRLTFFFDQGAASKLTPELLRDDSTKKMLNGQPQSPQNMHQTSPPNSQMLRGDHRQQQQQQDNHRDRDEPMDDE